MPGNFPTFSTKEATGICLLLSSSQLVFCGDQVCCNSSEVHLQSLMHLQFPKFGPDVFIISTFSNHCSVLYLQESSKMETSEINQSQLTSRKTSLTQKNTLPKWEINASHQLFFFIINK
jgi:hypothetical protein